MPVGGDFSGLTARGACLPAAAGRGRGEQGHLDAETLCRQGSIAEACLFTHPRAQINAARLRPSALLTTASQARHAPRLAPYVGAQRGRLTPATPVLPFIYLASPFDRALFENGLLGDVFPISAGEHP